jgi:hypothetical protein
MKGAIITLAVLAYMTGGFLTFGVVWNEQSRSCEPSRSFCATVGLNATLGGVFWPITWGGRLAIEATD